MRDALAVFRGTFRFFRRFPRCILPLLLAWCGYAAVTLWLRFGADLNRYTAGDTLALAFGVYFLFSLLFGLACLILLELLQQLEQNQAPGLLRAVRDALVRDLGKALPILLVWAALWFLLALLDALLSPRERKEKEPFSPRAAVGILTGAGRRPSLLRAGLAAAAKALRMFAFLVLPAVAWEDLGPVASVKKGVRTLRGQTGAFLAAYGLTELFALAVLLPPALLYALEDRLSLPLPDGLWWGILLYVALASSLTFLVEQLYVAQLYLRTLPPGRPLPASGPTAKPEQMIHLHKKTAERPGGRKARGVLPFLWMLIHAASQPVISEILTFRSSRRERVAASAVAIAARAACPVIRGRNSSGTGSPCMIPLK